MESFQINWQFVWEYVQCLFFSFDFSSFTQQLLLRSFPEKNILPRIASLFRPSQTVILSPFQFFLQFLFSILCSTLKLFASSSGSIQIDHLLGGYLLLLILVGNSSFLEHSDKLLASNFSDGLLLFLNEPFCKIVYNCVSCCGFIFV